MRIGDRLYEGAEDFEELQLQMALECESNGWCMEDGYDNGTRYLVINPPSAPALPTPEEIQRSLTKAVQNYMDTTVRERNYDSIHTACTYASSTDHVFAAEGIACVAWRDSVWRTCYTILAEVNAGAREIPTAEELIAELPALDW